MFNLGRNDDVKSGVKQSEQTEYVELQGQHNVLESECDELGGECGESEGECGEPESECAESVSGSECESVSDLVSESENECMSECGESESEYKEVNGQLDVECGDVCISKSCACRMGNKNSDACESENAAGVKDSEHDSDWSTDSDYEPTPPINQSYYKLAFLQNLLNPPDWRPCKSKYKKKKLK
jgi:hypothetical protein